VQAPIRSFAMQTPSSTPHPVQKASASRGWLWLLILPYLGLCFPVLYARNGPALWGFPFFYWYQFAWVVLTSAILGLVYRRTSR
jgi:hypothetical protein